MRQAVLCLNIVSNSFVHLGGRHKAWLQAVLAYTYWVERWQTEGIRVQTDLGDEDACIHNSFDVPQPAWALQTLQEVGHGGGPQLAHWKHNTAVSLAGNKEHSW